MGIRGVDIQVAIQRAAEADKLQQAQIAQARAGEAGIRESGELEKVKAREQTQKSEKGSRINTQTRNQEQSGQSGGKAAQQQSGDDGLEEPEGTRPADKHIDILA